ncbi:hypothetical protein [Streptomyces humi]|uniref:hypothetical protein n=1 Tax=Streptomyces humi TaxID=1428620 RepID=UPI0011607C86
MAEQKSSSTLTAPLRNAASAVRRVPGAGAVTRAAEGTLDKIGAVSPRSRRMAVYAGAGVLGVAGVVEWPVALSGAAIAWLTQPRPGQSVRTAPPEATGDPTAGPGRGAYVAVGDAATAQETATGTTAPGPVREDQMPEPDTHGPTAPSTEPGLPTAGPGTPDTEPSPPASESAPPTAALHTPDAEPGPSPVAEPAAPAAEPGTSTAESGTPAAEPTSSTAESDVTGLEPGPLPVAESVPATAAPVPFSPPADAESAGEPDAGPGAPVPPPSS